MNRNLKYLLLITGALLTLAAPTCEDEVPSGSKYEAEREKLQAVTADFSKESLTARNLEAFEYRASEKLMDYADYMGILYNRNLDEAFRSQARENIMDLFSGRSAPLDPLPEGIDPEAYSSLQFVIDTIEILVPLEKQPTEIYEGRMQYSREILGIAGSDTLNLDSSIHQMGMILQMGLKDFGGKSLIVWEVSLAEVE